MVQAIKDYEADKEKCAFVNAVLQGVADIDEGRTVTMADALKRLGLAYDQSAN